MPELPEVETVRRSLVPALYDGTITQVRTSDKTLRSRAIPTRELRALVGARFVAARRHGKYLLLDTSAGQTVLVHLGMAGQLLLVGDIDVRPHTHVELMLSSGRRLRFVDPRRFGIVRVLPTETVAASAELAELGPDPIASAFELGPFAAQLSSTKRELKSVLLDQRVVAGLGNIYVSEVLFTARLSVRRRAHRLTRAETKALHAAIGEVLVRAVANRGTSFSDYVDADGRSGENQHALWVYGRDGQPCRVCETPIVRLVQAARSSFYCPKCQRKRT